MANERTGRQLPGLTPTVSTCTAIPAQRTWEIFTQFVVHSLPNGHNLQNLRKRQDDPMSAQQTHGDNWVQTLFLKRRHGRRMQADDLLPPYLTEEGLVLIDRRSHADRRKPLVTDLANIPGHA